MKTENPEHQTWTCEKCNKTSEFTWKIPYDQFMRFHNCPMLGWSREDFSEILDTLREGIVIASWVCLLFFGFPFLIFVIKTL